MAASGGVTIFIVPTSLLINTYVEWQKQVDNDKAIEGGLRLYVRNTEYTGAARPEIEDPITGETVDLNKMCISADEIDAIHHMNREQLTQIMFLTTKSAYQARMIDLSLHTLPTARVLVDEFHQEPGMGTTVNCALRQLALWSACSIGITIRFTFITGAPLRMGARDLPRAGTLQKKFSGGKSNHSIQRKVGTFPHLGTMSLETADKLDTSKAFRFGAGQTMNKYCRLERNIFDSAQTLRKLKESCAKLP
ncbi:hypothetical protein DV738_g2176, partial [Chaetothyriales sp. CBS 135597]